MSRNTLVGAVLARNESDRFLRPVLERLRAVCDTVLLLDDRSTDDTPTIAHELGCTVRIRSWAQKHCACDPPQHWDGMACPKCGPRIGQMWGQEAPARAELWDWASKVAGEGWVLVCDADMELVGDPRPLLDTWSVNAWAWVLYDLWGAETYREDQFWRGHLFPRVWLVRPSGVPDAWSPVWPDRGLHAGHVPVNFPAHVGLAANLYWKHFAYLTPELRAQKHAQYFLHAKQLTEFEKQHAASIIEYDQTL